jgi:hypothetical protein
LKVCPFGRIRTGSSAGDHTGIPQSSRSRAPVAPCAAAVGQASSAARTLVRNGSRTVGAT